ncbi:MAG: Rab family GTPase [Promethearchaeota archaeon]
MMETEPQPRYVFKICLIGSGGVGKTCMAKRLCFDTFDARTQMTIGIDFYTYDIPIIVNNDDSFVRLTIWDFGGQEQFKNLFSYYINGANGIFLVFDLVEIESLTRLDWWYKQLVSHNLQNQPKILIGTKLDLVETANKQHKIDNLIIQQFLKRHNEKDFIKTSSKENKNIQKSFKELVKKILNAHNFDYDKLF